MSKRRIWIIAGIAAAAVIALVIVLLVVDAQRRGDEAALAEQQRAEQAEAAERRQAEQDRRAAEKQAAEERAAAEAAAAAEQQRLADEQAAAEQAAAEAAAAARAGSIDDPASITVVVNKQRPLNPIDYAPGDLVWPNVPNNNGQPMRAEAAAAIEQMYAAASADGAPFVIASAYRDYHMQTGLFQSYVQRDGVAAAETYSARPGHSEHQTGLVADVDDGSGCAFQFCFGDTAAGTWVRDNAYRFGFIVRYNQDQQGITGYIYEPYHLRYVGPEVAGQMRAQGIVNLEDYFGLPAAPTY